MDPIRSRNALKGFRRLAQGLSRAPLPWIAVCAILGAGLHRGLVDFSLAVLIMFIAYLRPVELLQLTGVQLIAPLKGSGTRWWAVLIAPEELGIGTKTRQYDESVLLDWEIIPKLGSLLAANCRLYISSLVLWVLSWSFCLSLPPPC